MINKVKSRNELADLLGISRKRLTYLLYIKHLENMYTSFEIPKKSGGQRLINAPNKELKLIQRRLANELYEYHTRLNKDKQINGVSQAFEKGKSIFTNAKIHRKKRFIINVDLENFFDNIHFGRVRGYLIKNKDFQLSEEVATVIAQLTCFKGSLPQGAPTSPIISNYICNIFNLRIIKLAKKYKLNYTRYADDLTFSTNEKYFMENWEDFMENLKKEVERAGFHLNEKKTRISYEDSRQEVTGVIVNKKISIKREYYKNTRAMANNLYKTGEFYINGEKGSLNQLEGRFTFINQAECFGKKIIFQQLNGREKEYQKFLFFKYFYANEKPLIVTEGKTDVIYLKAALKKMYRDYPELVTRDDKGGFHYNLSFLKKSMRLKNYLNIQSDGADTMKNIYLYYSKQSNKNYPQYIKEFENIRGSRPQNVVIMLFDNELKEKDRPISKFCKGTVKDEQKVELQDKLHISLETNLFLMVTPLKEGKEISDIEDLFPDEVLNIEIDGKKFTKNDKYDTKENYGKDRFAKYVMKNYGKINFDGFRPLLDKIKFIIMQYKEGDKWEKED